MLTLCSTATCSFVKFIPCTSSCSRQKKWRSIADRLFTSLQSGAVIGSPKDMDAALGRYLRRFLTMGSGALPLRTVGSEIIFSYRPSRRYRLTQPCRVVESI